MFDRLLDIAFRRAARGTMKLESCAGAAPAPGRPVFLYAHIPFCEVLCPYCSFHRVRLEGGKAQRYFVALRQEIRRYHELGYQFNGLYVGGGTPTALPDELAATLALIRELNRGLAHISVETNPKDLRPDVLSMLEAAGVDRLSVGVQTFDDGLLKQMERFDKYGGRSEILERLASAATRVRTLNVDMIWNLPHQTEAMLEADLDTLRACAANQVSLYPLMMSRSSARKMARTMGVPVRSRMRRSYQCILKRLTPAFQPTSAWCFGRGGQGIDEYIVDAADYVGIGSGAFSFLNGAVYATTFSLNSYAELIGRGLTGVTGWHPLASRERMRYDFLMRMFGLRLEKSWARERYGGRFERDLALELLGFRLLGAVVEDERGWALTPEGMYQWVRMMSAFFESVNEFREQMRHHIRAELNDDAVAEVHVPLAELRHGPVGVSRVR